jgi:hypothetical protein
MNEYYVGRSPCDHCLEIDTFTTTTAARVRAYLKVNNYRLVVKELSTQSAQISYI